MSQEETKNQNFSQPQSKFKLGDLFGSNKPINTNNDDSESDEDHKFVQDHFDSVPTEQE